MRARRGPGAPDPARTVASALAGAAGFAAASGLAVVTALGLAGCAPSASDGAEYLGQVPPGDDAAAPFAPGVISRDDRYEQFLLITPDGSQLLYGITRQEWDSFELRALPIGVSGLGSEQAPAYLGGETEALTVAISADGLTAFHAIARPSYPPSDIWVTRAVDGAWTTPEQLPWPVSSGSDEFEISVSAAGTLYFSSDRPGGRGGLDLYRAPRVAGAYPVVEHLGGGINTEHGDDLPYIAPDESYLIFASDRPGGFGARDLYVSFRAEAAWSEPHNLGATINTEHWELYPFVSPDGRFLFFTRRPGGWDAVDDSDIYWIRAGVIERLRRQARWEPVPPGE